MRHRLPRSAFRLLALVAVAGCGANDPIQTEERIPTSITLSPDNVIMTFLNQSIQLTARVVDQNDIVMPTPIEWTLSDPSVASISAEGLITALAVGNATLTATGLGLSVTADVEVVQTVSSFTAVQGADQEAIRDSTLADPIIVRVTDQGGTGIPGLTVSFLPAPGDGTVSVASVDTDANGEATTEWTLGPTFGEQELLASIPGQSLSIEAIARAEVPTPDLAVVSPLSLSSASPSTLETVTARASIKNIGDLASGPTRVSLTANSVEVGTFDLPSLNPNDSTEVQIDIGPLAEGSATLEFVADADDAVIELFETNNTASRTVNVVAQTAVTVGVPISNIDAAIDEELLFQVNVTGPTTLTVSFDAPNGDADVYVAEATRPSLRDDYNACRSYGSTSQESCQVPFAEGTYHILVHAFDQGSGFTGGTLSVTTGDALVPFNIQIEFVVNGTQSQEDAFIAAAARWSQVIVADVQDWDFSGNPLPADFCMDGQPELNTVVDDVIIYVDLSTIDGQGGVLGQAGPCIQSRQGTNHTIVGRMQFDDADLVQVENNGLLEGLILHEMGHVLGIGTWWNQAGLLRNPSFPNSAGADTHFPGLNAIAAFDNIGGVAFTGSKVPVENEANLPDAGSADSHWRETVMDTELMTPFLDPVGNELSEVTVASMKDLGYGVDPTAFDTYFLAPTPAARAQAGGPLNLAGMLYVGDDIWPVEEGYLSEQAGKLRKGRGPLR